MAAANHNLAESLEALHAAARGGVVRASALSRTHRERLQKSGFLQEVIKGWLITTNPAESSGSSTAWYASYWSFVSQYLAERFGDDYCLSAEVSLFRHIESSTVPLQVTVVTQSGSNQVVKLPFDTSLLIYQNPSGIPAPRVMRDGLWLLDLAAVLCRIPPGFFRIHPQEAEIALRMIGGPAPLLRELLAEGQSVVAGRLAGALGFLGDMAAHDQILSAMRTAGFDVRVSNPFESEAPSLPFNVRVRSPQAARITSLWNTMREDVIRIFPEPPGLPDDPDAYLAAVEERYVSDAYNSLSIEGYQVSPQLIERVRQGQWRPDASATDNREHDALAARGYFQAFQAVKLTLVSILRGAPPGEKVERDHTAWYQEMFAPAVQAGILPAATLAGYRSTPVYLRNSRHVPPAPSAVIDCLEAYFECLKGEEHPAVTAVLSHFLFVYIHPYPDGNGRIGRFLMNALLATGGYPWTIIRLSRREQYMDALEAASVGQDIAPLSSFLLEEMQSG